MKTVEDLYDARVHHEACEATKQSAPPLTATFPETPVRSREDGPPTISEHVRREVHAKKTAAGDSNETLFVQHFPCFVAKRLVTTIGIKVRLSSPYLSHIWSLSNLIFAPVPSASRCAFHSFSYHVDPHPRLTRLTVDLVRGPISSPDVGRPNGMGHLDLPRAVPSHVRRRSAVRPVPVGGTQSRRIVVFPLFSLRRRAGPTSARDPHTIHIFAHTAINIGRTAHTITHTAHILIMLSLILYYPSYFPGSTIFFPILCYYPSYYIIPHTVLLPPGAAPVVQAALGAHRRHEPQSQARHRHLPPGAPSPAPIQAPTYLDPLPIQAPSYLDPLPMHLVAFTRAISPLQNHPSPPTSPPTHQ